MDIMFERFLPLGLNMDNTFGFTPMSWCSKAHLCWNNLLCNMNNQHKLIKHTIEQQKKIRYQNIEPRICTISWYHFSQLSWQEIILDKPNNLPRKKFMEICLICKLKHTRCKGTYSGNFWQPRGVIDSTSFYVYVLMKFLRFGLEYTKV